MKCPFSFTCYICKLEYHSLTPKEEQLEEHEERKKAIEHYADEEDLIEVCDPCFKKHVEPHFVPIQKN